MRIATALLLALCASPALAGATCAPVSTEASILASADMNDIHPQWADGSTVGLSWSLDLQGDEEGADGAYFLYGDLIDPRGNVATRGVYVSDMEWECDSE